MRTSIATLVGGMAAILCSGSCMTSPAAPAPAPNSPLTIGGTWTGTLSDSQGGATVTWTITQSGSALSGTAVTRPLDPGDGTCASCHKNKTGTLSGTLSGTTMALTMTFPGGTTDEPTPICSVTLNATAPGVADDVIAATYVGSDSCEGPVENGRVNVGRRR